MAVLQKVLIVDDSLSSRLVLRRMLERRNINADMAASAKEAIDFLNHHKPDAIFMDHEMPEMNGLQALELLKDNPATKAIPVAMFTTREEAEYAKTALQYGAIGVLPKPFNDGALSGIIQALQASHKAAPSAQEDHGTPSNDGKVNGAAPALDIKTLEVMIRSIVQDVVSEQVMPTLNKQVTLLKEDFHAEQQTALAGQPLTAEVPAEVPADRIEAIALTALMPKLEDLIQQRSFMSIDDGEQISEKTLSKATALIKSARQDQNIMIENRLDALEQEWGGRFGEIQKWLLEQRSPTHYDMMDNARPIIQTNRDSQKTDIIDVIPEQWLSEKYHASQSKTSSVDGSNRKLRQVYVFTGVTTIIIGLVISGLFLLSNLLQVYQDFKP